MDSFDEFREKLKYAAQQQEEQKETVVSYASMINPDVEFKSEVKISDEGYLKKLVSALKDKYDINNNYPTLCSTHSGGIGYSNTTYDNAFLNPNIISNPTYAYPRVYMNTQSGPYYSPITIEHRPEHKIQFRAFFRKDYPTAKNFEDDINDFLDFLQANRYPGTLTLLSEVIYVSYEINC